ncbi:MAG: YaeQ family protein [Pseudomonadota bacterium]
MALKSTIIKVTVEIADIDRGYYATHALTIARHPSETDRRMMVRLLAFCMHAHENLAFGRGVSSDDEADIWQHNDIGDVELWIMLGEPDVDRVRKASRQSQQVVVYAYQSRSASVWWQRNHALLAEIKNLQVWQIPDQAADQMETMVERTMQVQCTIQDGLVFLTNGDSSITVEPLRLDV